MGKYCVNCGKVLHAGARFCAKCGAAALNAPSNHVTAAQPKSVPQTQTKTEAQPQKPIPPVAMPISKSSATPKRSGWQGALCRGLRVLEVLPDYIGSKMGIESGDILLSVNGKSINSEEMLIETLGQAPLYLWMDLDRRGEVITLEYRHYRRGEDKLGIVFVPRKTSRYFQADEQGGLALRLWRRLVQRNNGAQN